MEKFRAFYVYHVVQAVPTTTTGSQKRKGGSSHQSLAGCLVLVKTLGKLIVPGSIIFQLASVFHILKLKNKFWGNKFAKHKITKVEKEVLGKSLVNKFRI